MEVKALRIVVLILITILLIAHVGCNQPFVNESHRITSPWYYGYLETFFDVSGDFMVVGTRSGHGPSYFSYEYKANVSVYTLTDNEWKFSYATSVDDNLSGVAIDGNEIAVLSSTSLYILEHVYGESWNSYWKNETALPLPTFPNTRSSCCVNMKNGTIVFGTFRTFWGNTYLNVFTKENGLWNSSQQIHIEPCTAEPSISMFNDLIAVYCFVSSSFSHVFIFKRKQNMWIQQSRFKPSNKLNQFHKNFAPIALYGDVMAVRKNNPYDSQVIKIYRLLNGTWEMETQIAAMGDYNRDRGDVSLSQDHLLIVDFNFGNSNTSSLRIYRYQNGTWEHQVNLRDDWLENLDRGDMVYQKMLSGIIRNDDVFITSRRCTNCQMAVHSYFNVASASKEKEISLNTTEHPTEEPKTHYPTLKCDELNMTAYWTKKTFQGDNITITIKDGTCNNLEILENATTIWVTIPFFACESPVIENDITIIIRNTAVVRATRTHNDIIVRKDKFYHFNVECVFQRDIFASMHSGYETNNHNTITYNQSSLGYVKASMSMFETSFFDQKLTYPIKITMGEKIHVGVNIQRNPNVKMVVQKCFATASPELSGESYVFFTDMCSLDDTFEVTSQTNHQFRFSITAFRFIRVKRAVFLHCAVLICEHNSLLRECQQECSTRVRRNVIHESAPDVSNLKYVTSGKIIYERKQTCADIAKNCPINSNCVDMYPPICRCIDGFVMSDEDGSCETKRIIKMKKLHIDTEWNDEFYNPSSPTFMKFAIIMETRLFHFFVKVLKIIGLKGIRVDSAVPGSVYLDFSLIYAKNTTRKHVTESISHKLRNANTTSEEIQDVKIILDNLPIIDQVENNDITLLQLVVAISVPVVLLSAIAMFFYAKWHRKEKKDVPDSHVPNCIKLAVS